MGSLYSGLCYSSVQEAESAFWSSAPPVFSAEDGGPFYAQYLNGQWVGCSGTTCAVLPSIGFPSCDLGGPATDGLLVGSGVVGVWVAVWAIMQIRRAL